MPAAESAAQLDHQALAQLNKELSQLQPVVDTLAQLQQYQQEVRACFGV